MASTHYACSHGRRARILFLPHQLFTSPQCTSSNTHSMHIIHKRTHAHMPACLHVRSVQFFNILAIERIDYYSAHSRGKRQLDSFVLFIKQVSPGSVFIPSIRTLHLLRLVNLDKKQMPPRSLKRHCRFFFCCCYCCCCCCCCTKLMVLCNGSIAPRMHSVRNFFNFHSAPTAYCIYVPPARYKSCTTLSHEDLPVCLPSLLRPLHFHFTFPHPVRLFNYTSP